MTTTLLPPPATDSAAPHHPNAAALAHMLELSVEQLLLAALARARAVPAPWAARLASAEPVPALRTPVRPAVLTGREFEVLQHLAHGECNKTIARTLALSPHTVKRHVSNILQKLDLHTRGQAAAWWRAQQLQQHFDPQPRALEH